jgi:hypothetical protein
MILLNCESIEEINIKKVKLMGKYNLVFSQIEKDTYFLKESYNAKIK